MTITESLLEIAKLTKQNLQILKLLNNSFHTKSAQLSATIGETTYTIPSYIALENKVNHIQASFDNLVHSAASGEAWFNFYGNSREICVRGYESAPSPIVLNNSNQFKVQDNFLFKDLLTPQPSVVFDISNISLDCSQVLVKKIVFSNINLIDRLKSESKSVIDDGKEAMYSLSWNDLQKILQSSNPVYQNGKDYIEYEKEYSLPINNNVYSGEYVIEQIVKEYINSDFENEFVLRIHKLTPLYKTHQDGIIQKELEIGDELLTWDGSAKLAITEINQSDRTIVVRVLHGAYTNLVNSELEASDKTSLLDKVSDFAKLRLYSQSNIKKNINIPLEEDKFIYIAISPISPRLRTRASWNFGVLVNVFNLKIEINDGTTLNFKQYYDKYIKNVGDCLNEFTQTSFAPLSSYTQNERKLLQQAPILDENCLKVIQINKHLNDSPTIKNILALYSQKKTQQRSLEEVQNKIQTLSDELSNLSFGDITGVRAAIEAQLSDLKVQQNNISIALIKTTEDISKAAYDASIPIDNAKFRIRGYLDLDKYIEQITKDYTGEEQQTLQQKLKHSVLGIRVYYRYVNREMPNSNVDTINEFTFSEWNLYEAPVRNRTLIYNNSQCELIEGGFDTKNKKLFDKSSNDLKCFQIDVPIVQGESVELKAQVVWGHGYPYTQQTTDWSASILVNFPDELNKVVNVLNIITENNNDIETNRFTNLLKENGYTAHIEDKVQDQDITFYHRPESISSGFYTDERRVIPLKDKLQEFQTQLSTIQDLLQGSFEESVEVAFEANGTAIPILQNQQNVFHLPSYNSIKGGSDNTATGTAFKKNNVVYLVGNFKITNLSKHLVRIFSVVPGARDMNIQELPEGYVYEYKQILGYDDKDEKWKDIPLVNLTEFKSVTQRCNQFVYFTKLNPFTKQKLYVGNEKYESAHDVNGNDPTKWKTDIQQVLLYPIVFENTELCIESDSTYSYKDLKAGESLVVPISIEYMLNNSHPSDTKTIGIVVRNSLYRDPSYYECTIVAKLDTTTSDQLSQIKGKNTKNNSYKAVIR